VAGVGKKKVDQAPLWLKQRKEKENFLKKLKKRAKIRGNERERRTFAIEETGVLSVPFMWYCRSQARRLGSKATGDIWS
jgi:hypothetical protein